MPLHETEPVKARQQFIIDYPMGLYPMPELCARSGSVSSRKTVYKWLARFADAGLAGLLDYSRAPLSCPHRIVPDVLAVVRASCE